MNIILIMIPLSLILLAAAVGAFFWAANHGQFDDMQSPGLTPMSDNLPEEDEDEERQESEPTDDTKADPSPPSREKQI